MRRKVVSLVGLLQAAAILTVVFSIVTALPVDHFSIQLFTHFKLQYLIVSVFLCVVFAFLRQPIYVAGLLIAVGLNASLVIPWYIADSEFQWDQQLNVLHANVLSTNTDHEALFELVRAEKPDVVVLQEVSSQWLMALDTLRQDFPYSYAEARDGNFGIALFSRVPLISISHVDSPPTGYPTLVATLDLGSESLRLISTHPTIPLGQQLYTDRNEQLESIRTLLTGHTGPLVLVGDLNTGMWDSNYRSLENETGLRNARTGFGVIPTWPTFMPFAMIPIDHVLVSDDVGVVEMRSGPRIGSDHLPLIVTLAL